MGDFGGRGHFKSRWLPWLPNNNMQRHNNTFHLLRNLSDISEPNLVRLSQTVFDIQLLKLLGTFEMEAIFAPTVIHTSEILFETILWGT